MLLTTCPNCAARFKVQPDQLSVRQGRVMCGRCRHVFNAFESLKRDESPTITEDVYEVDAAPDAEPVPEVSVDPGPLSVPGPAWFATPEPGVPPELANVAHHVSTKTMESGAVVAVRQEETQSPPVLSHEVAAKTAPTKTLLEASNPLLQKPAYNAKAPSTRGWSVGVVAATLLLTLQTIYYFRSAIVQFYPQLRPQIVAACSLVGCTVPWGRSNEAIVVQTSELMEMPAQPGHALLTATLINKSSTRQDLPYLEVRLTDNANQVLVNRNLTPSQYLGRPVSGDESVAANAEVFVNLHLEISTKLTASGYALRPFYP